MNATSLALAMPTRIRAAALALAMPTSILASALIVCSMLLLWPVAAAAQLKVMISGGFAGAYTQMLPQFEAESGIKVTTGSGASQGTGPQTIMAQIARGVPADVVILSGEGLAELIAAKLVIADTKVALSRAGLGVGVKAGAPKPDVSTVEAFKTAVLAAKVIAVPGSTSGIWLTKELFPRLGLADKLDVKVTPRGSDSTKLVAAGGANLAIQPISEILPAPGVELAGALAADIQLYQIYSAAIVTGSKEIDGARRMIAFLTSPRMADAIRNNGMDPEAAAR